MHVYTFRAKYFLGYYLACIRQYGEVSQAKKCEVAIQMSQND